MAGFYVSVDDYEKSLESAVDIAMETVIADEVVKEIQTFARNRLYRYTPQFRHRRVTSGGLIDPDNMDVFYDSETKTLEVELLADWQNLSDVRPVRRMPGGADTSESLADALQEQQIYNAPPRPFMEPAEAYYSRRRFDRDLERALNEMGF